MDHRHKLSELINRQQDDIFLYNKAKLIREQVAADWYQFTLAGSQIWMIKQ
jgi:hypothetical protein